MKFALFHYVHDNVRNIVKRIVRKYYERHRERVTFYRRISTKNKRRSVIRELVRFVKFPAYPLRHLRTREKTAAVGNEQYSPVSSDTYGTYFVGIAAAKVLSSRRIAQLRNNKRASRKP